MMRQPGPGMILLPTALAILALALAAPAADPDPYDQSGVPLEVQPDDAKLKKIVLVAGRQSHGPGDHEFFAGCAILMKLLKQTAGVFPAMARDSGSRALRWHEFLDRGIDTATGRTKAGPATVLVLVLPFLILCFGIAVATIAALV